MKPSGNAAFYRVRFWLFMNAALLDLKRTDSDRDYKNNADLRHIFLPRRSLCASARDGMSRMKMAIFVFFVVYYWTKCIVTRQHGTALWRHRHFAGKNMLAQLPKR